MRGKRAFVVLTINLVLIAGFAWMIESFAERSFASGFGSSISASAEIGRQMFTAMLFLMTLIVLVIAPASTAGAISLEREKQTLDLLTTTPISSLAIVLGKLLSALSWVFLLMLASIPVCALVFTFGGVGPDDLVRGYTVLFVTALAFGSLGLFVSALVKRTQAATVINLVVVIALTAGTAFLWVFWTSMTGSRGFLPDENGGGSSGLVDSLTKRPPEALMWFNPFVSQVDVVCGTETGFGGSCQIIGAVTNTSSGVGAQGGAVPAPFPGDQVPAFGVARDSYWPRALGAMIAISVILIVLSVQLVSPTRRWRLRPQPREAVSWGSS
jgi:hypothetical protein